MTRFIRFALLVMVCVFAGTELANGQSYLHDDVNKIYGKLGTRDKLSEALRLKDSAERQFSREWPGTEAEADLEKAIVLFSQVAKSNPTVTDDLVAAVKIAEGARYYSGFDRLADVLRAELDSGNKNVVRALERIYQVFLKQLRENKFNPTIRYTEAVMKKLRHTRNDPFGCMYSSNQIGVLTDISRSLGAKDRIRLWELHTADSLVTDHNCEGGWDFGYDEAYGLYTKHGEVLNARKAAESEGDQHLNLYSQGTWFEPEGRLIDAAGDTSEWLEMMDWYKKAGLTQVQLKAKFQKAAAEAEDDAATHRRNGHPNSYRGSLVAAIKLYEFVGNTAKVSRLRLELPKR